MSNDHSPSADELRELAADIAEQAYAPYSGFRVGTAVRGARGVYVGTNVENASYGLGVCAERTALSAAVAAGDLEIDLIAVACIDADPEGPVEEVMSCGACRQWIQELAPNAEVLLSGRSETFTVEDLLPNAFRLDP